MGRLESEAARWGLSHGRRQTGSVTRSAPNIDASAGPRTTPSGIACRCSARRSSARRGSRDHRGTVWWSIVGRSHADERDQDPAQLDQGRRRADARRDAPRDRRRLRQRHARRRGVSRRSSSFTTARLLACRWIPSGRGGAEDRPRRRSTPRSGEGTARDAILHGIGSNATHGLGAPRRTSGAPSSDC